MIELGNNMVLVGFKELDKGSLIIVKKMVGTAVKKMSEINDKFESFKLTLKPVHEQEDSKKFEVHGQVVFNGKMYNSEIVERNLFVAVSSVLDKLESLLMKDKEKEE